MIELTVLNDNAFELNQVDDGLIGLDVVMATGGGSEIRNQDKTVVPTESEQSVTADAGYTGLGTVTVDGIDPDYVGSEVPRKSSSDLTASGATVNVPAGYYSASASKAVASGTEGTPTATKGAVSNHSVSVTPSVTNSAGYISGGTKTGSAVSVSASELVSGTKQITANGTEDVTNYASVSVAVPQPSGTKNITISANGTTTEDVTNYASASITANVPNTYSASDEGKVVDNGALVSQTSDTVTANDTYDTTLINSLTVNVSGGGITYDDVATKNSGDGILTLTGSTIKAYAFREFQFTTLIAPNLTYIGREGLSYNKFSALFFQKLISIGQDAFIDTTPLTTIVCKGGVSSFGYGALRNLNNLVAFDMGAGTSASIASNAILSCTKLATIVIRKSSVVALANVNSLNATAFNSSRAGGTLYVPSALISSYQSASNWSTILGYANNNIVKIEGSQYENYYVDGTPIS